MTPHPSSLRSDTFFSAPRAAFGGCALHTPAGVVLQEKAYFRFAFCTLRFAFKKHGTAYRAFGLYCSSGKE